MTDYYVMFSSAAAAVMAQASAGHWPTAMQVFHWIAEAAGIVTFAPRIIAWFTVKSTVLADWVFGALMSVPWLGQLILYFAPDIIKFLEDLSNAIEGLVDTFANRLEDNIRRRAEARTLADEHPPVPEAKPAPETAVTKSTPDSEGVKP